MNKPNMRKDLRFDDFCNLVECDEQCDACALRDARIKVTLDVQPNTPLTIEGETK